jgi:hypothetical protein
VGISECIWLRCKIRVSAWFAAKWSLELNPLNIPMADRIGISNRTDCFDEFFHERRETMPGHVLDEFVEHASLAE